MEVEIFTDETYFKNFQYIGIMCLFVPTSHKKKFVNQLSNLRCPNSNWKWSFEDCEIKCNNNQHELNNSEVHFKNLNKASRNKINICEKWIDFLMNYNKNKDEDDDCIYFKILYLDLEKIDKTQFGDKADKNNMYNRFYRSMIIGARKFFFTDSYFVIKEFFHDNASDKEHHDKFPWHTPTKLDRSRDFNILKEEITFIDSNHKSYNDWIDKENAQIIQFVDLTLGSITEAIFRKDQNKKKIKMANEIFPLVKRLWKRPKNTKSSFNYYRKQDVSIFPRDKIQHQENLFHELTQIEGQYHRNIPIREIRDYKNENGPLDKYFS